MRVLLLVAALLLAGCVDTDTEPLPPQPPEVYCLLLGSQCGCSKYAKDECDDDCCEWVVGENCQCKPEFQ